MNYANVWAEYTCLGVYTYETHLYIYNTWLLELAVNLYVQNYMMYKNYGQLK